MRKSITLATATLLATAAYAAPSMVFAGASSPADVVKSLESYFVTDDVASMMTLYNDESVMAAQPGSVVKGAEAIRPILQGYADIAEKIDLQVRNVYRTGDTALLLVDYIMTVNDKDGKLVEITGTATDVVKLADDGTWYYLIDNPFGVATP